MLDIKMKILSLAEKNPDCLTGLSEGFRTGRLSVREYLRRLESLFAEKEPWIKAFVREEIDPFERLRQEFAELESRFPDPFSRPLLYGIPVGVKDIFHVEGLPTHAGSRFPQGPLRGPEAKSVSILKSAGALVLGKTVTTEFAYCAPSPTRNPYHLNHTAGGSSSGSAAAVAAGLCPLALGTQTSGSILRPASYCGVVGFKPSYARISLEGLIPLAPSVDHVGFFTAHVEGAILVATVLCKGWTPVGKLTRPVFGVSEGPYMEKASEEGLSHFRRTCDRLSDAGFEIRHVEMLRDIEEIIERHSILVAAEAAKVHQKWFRDYPELYHEKTAELIHRGQTVRPEVLAACHAGCKRLQEEILKMMERHNLSALLAPAAVGPAPRGFETTGDPVMNMPWTQAGLPAVSLPSGLSREGLPLGVQMVGSWMGDEILLEVAKLIAELLTQKW